MPLIVKFDVADPVRQRVALMFETVPANVSVFAPIERVPPLKVREPLIDALPDRAVVAPE